MPSSCVRLSVAWLRHVTRFYRAKRGIYRRCVCVCVCVCVTLRYCVKTAKCRITQIMTHDRSGTLVYILTSASRGPSAIAERLVPLFFRVSNDKRFFISTVCARILTCMGAQVPRQIGRPREHLAAVAAPKSTGARRRTVLLIHCRLGRRSRSPLGRRRNTTSGFSHSSGTRRISVGNRRDCWRRIAVSPVVASGADFRRHVFVLPVGGKRSVTLFLFTSGFAVGAHVRRACDFREISLGSFVATND